MFFGGYQGTWFKLESTFKASWVGYKALALTRYNFAKRNHFLEACGEHRWGATSPWKIYNSKVCQNMA